MKIAVQNPRETSDTEKKIALRSLKPAKVLVDSLKNKRTVKVGVQGSDSLETIEIPRSAFEFLVYILGNMAEGKAISIAPIDKELTTEEAASLIGVSRPYLTNKLLETGKIPFSKVGKHRRIKLKDTLDYIEQKEKERKENLRLLAEQSQDLNLGY